MKILLLVLSLAAAAAGEPGSERQAFIDAYGTSDSGHYVQLGTAVYKSLTLSDRFGVQPFIGFGFVAESYTFGGGPAARTQ